MHNLVSSGIEGAKRERRLSKAVSKRRGYLLGTLLIILVTLLGQLLHNLFTPTTMLMMYLLLVVITAYLWGLGPSILVSILGVLAFDFFLVQPFLSFTVADTQYIFTFFVLLLVGVVISYLTSRVRQQSEAARRRECQMASLYALGRDLAISNDLESYIIAIVKRAKETFGLDMVLFLPDPENKKILTPYPGIPHAKADENEQSAAIRAFRHQKIIGYGTDTLPSHRSRYVPLVTARGTVGVIVVSPADTDTGLTMEQERLLEAYTDLAAVAIESILLGEEAHNAQVLRDTEKLQTALLNAVSHDLRTPLVSIIGVLSSLQEEGMNLDNVAKRNLVQVAREEAERLNHLITNLLDVSRVESGAIGISRQLADIEDLIGTTLEQMGSRVSTRVININIPAGLPFVSVDFGLIVQTLVNILDNALKYSSPDSPIDITGQQLSQEVRIEVADRGVGIPPQDLLHVFDKFYRIHRPDNVAGTGLGLSICKGIVEAHGGQINAENRPGGGTIITLALPVAEPGQNVKEIINAR